MDAEVRLLQHLSLPVVCVTKLTVEIYFSLELFFWAGHGP